MSAAVVRAGRDEVVFERDVADAPRGDFRGIVRGWRVSGRWEIYSGTGTVTYLRLFRVLGGLTFHQLHRLSTAVLGRLGADRWDGAA